MTRTIQSLLAVVMLLGFITSLPAAQILGFRSDDPGIVESGGFITSWPDSAGTAQDATASIDNYTGPTLASVDVNGGARNVVRFNGSTQILTAPQTVPAEGSLFIVMNSTGGGNQRVIGWEDNSFGNGGIGLSPTLAGQIYAILRSPNSDMHSGPAVGGDYETLSLTWGSSGNELWRSGEAETSTKIASTTGATSITDLGYPLHIGGPGDFEINGFKNDALFKGDILEMRVYDNQLLGADREAVEATLYNDWLSGTAVGPPPVVDPTLLLQFRADNPTVAAGPVNVWPDESGNGKNASVLAGRNPPTKTTVDINGIARDALNFDGSQALTAAEKVPTDAGTVFMVMRGSAGRAIGWEDACCGGGGLGISPDIGGQLFAITRPGTDVKAGPILSPTDAEVVAVSWGPDGKKLYRDGAVVNEVSGAASLNDLGYDLNIGASGDNMGPFTGDIFEIQVYDKQLSDTTSVTFDSVNAELTGRWIVPEPSSLILLSLGTLVLMWRRRLIS